MSLSCKATLLILATGLSCSGQDFHKFTFEGGVGPTIPMSSARDRWNTGWNLLFGGGYNFNSHVSGLLEMQYNRFSLSDAALQNFNQPAGYIRFWGLSLSPRYDFNPEGKYDVYATGGYGFYGRTLAFTDPSLIQQYCDPFYGYCQSTGAPVIASYTNYRGGFNLGGGFSYALGESGLKFFTDVRYNRFLSHSNTEFMTLTFGIRY
jgi:opacity protein-like surface antigen